MKRTAIFLCQKPDKIFRVYADRTALPCEEIIYTKEDLIADPAAFCEVEYVFSTWDMPKLTEEEIGTLLPSLKAVFYGAGSVQSFAAPFLARGVRVFSAWAANAIPVAEYTLAQILLANKGYFPLSLLQSRGERREAKQLAPHFSGNFDVTVGIIGVGMIGRLVIELLKSFRIKVLAWDAFLSRERIAALGAEKAELEELFERCEVISNHLADKPETRGMLGGALFSRMKPYATFINTGRGAQVVEEELSAVLKERGDLTALLDVTYPEPPVDGHPFYALENVFLTPHIAGSGGREVARMGEYMAEAYRELLTGKPSLHEVTAEMLATMA